MQREYLEDGGKTFWRAIPQERGGGNGAAVAYKISFTFDFELFAMLLRETMRASCFSARQLKCLRKRALSRM